MKTFIKTPFPFIVFKVKLNSGYLKRKTWLTPDDREVSPHRTIKITDTSELCHMSVSSNESVLGNVGAFFMSLLSTPQRNAAFSFPVKSFWMLINIRSPHILRSFLILARRQDSYISSRKEIMKKYFEDLITGSSFES